MIILTVAIVLTLAVLLFTISVRVKDLPDVEAGSPFAHLDEHKVQIYENLRDLTFEYRVGKLSEEDYQRSKAELQRELSGVLAEIDKVKASLGMADAPKGASKPKPVEPQPPAPPEPAPPPAAEQPAPAPAAAVTAVNGTACPRCGAQFPQKLKFCGECGQPMGAEDRA